MYISVEDQPAPHLCWLARYNMRSRNSASTEGRESPGLQRFSTRILQVLSAFSNSSSASSDQRLHCWAGSAILHHHCLVIIAGWSSAALLLPCMPPTHTWCNTKAHFVLFCKYATDSCSAGSRQVCTFWFAVTLHFFPVYNTPFLNFNSF
jgi:hypothetical protein